MRAPQTVTRYLAGEMVLTTTLGFLAAAPVVLVPNLFDRLDEFVVVGVTAGDLAVVMRCVVLLVSAYALPVAFLFGLMAAVGRLSADGEIRALRSCGVGLSAFLVPALLVASAVSAVSAWLIVGVEPRAKRELTSLSLQLASRGSVIETGRFQQFGRRMIYAQERRDGPRLHGVMISDWSTEGRPFLVFAESAQLRFDGSDGRLHLMLENGEIRMERRLTEAYDESRIVFAGFDYAFDAGPLGGDRWRFRPDQLTLAELRHVIARAEAGDPLRDLRYSKARVYRAQIHRMLSVPVSPLLFALVGVPLALRGLVRTRARGLLIALAVLTAYYGLFVYGQDAARAGVLPPGPAIWLPNLLLLVASVPLLRRAARAPG